MKKTLLTSCALVSSVFSVFAQVTITLGSQATGIKGLINMTQGILTRLVPILIGLAVLALFWFIIKFIWMAKDNPEEQIKARVGMGYSIFALFVMVSIWGIIGLIGSTLGVGQGGSMSGFKVPGEK